MTTGAAEPAPGPGVETLSLGPAGPPRNWARFHRPALIGGLGLLAVAVLGLAGFSVYGLVVGGSATAQGAANDVVANLNAGDLRALYQQLEPHEREAYGRAAAGLTRNVRQFGFGGAGQGSAERDQVSLDGIDLRLTGVRPTVRKLTPDVALLQYSTGVVTVSIRPAETTRLVQVGLAAAHVVGPVTRTQPLADLVNPAGSGGEGGPGVGLIAIRTGLRWYVSPAASAAWISQVSSGEVAAEDLTLTLTKATGSASAGAAAEASLTAALRSAGNSDFDPFAATLARSEQVAAEILAAEGPAGAADAVGGESVRIAEVRFGDGPRQGSRQLAYLEKLDARSTDEAIRADGTCLGIGSTKVCATDPSYGSVGPNVVGLFASEGRLAVAARHGHDGWKVSLADTLADGVVSWSAGLTREQAVLVFGLAHLEPPEGAIGEGRSTVTYNPAGYAVRSLTVATSGRYVFAGPGGEDLGLDLRPASGGGEIDLTPDGEIEPTYSGESYRLTAGDYVVVLWAAGGPAPDGNRRTEPLVVKRVAD
jgi:hypothetical protein